MPNPVLIQPYCTKEWADAFFSEYVFDEYWDEASNEKKTSALKAATDFINIYCDFYDKDMNKKVYEPDGTNDFTDEIIPRRLKQACAQEAAYLLSLDDNPAEPHPLTILGLIRGEFGTVDPSLVPPVFSMQVVRLLQMVGGVVDVTACGAQQFGFDEKNLTM